MPTHDIILLLILLGVCGPLVWVVVRFFISVIMVCVFLIVGVILLVVRWIITCFLTFMLVLAQAIVVTVTTAASVTMLFFNEIVLQALADHLCKRNYGFVYEPDKLDDILEHCKKLGRFQHVRWKSQIGHKQIVLFRKKSHAVTAALKIKGVV